MDNNNNDGCEEPTYSFNGEEHEESVIEITINSIENIIRDDDFSIKFVVEHDETILGESELLSINTNYGNIEKIYPVNFTSEIVFSLNDAKHVDSMVSSPILIKVFEIFTVRDLSVKSVDAKGRRKSKADSKRPSKIDEQLIGLCNIDLLPMILGETSCNEKLVLETPSYFWDNNMVSWANLPRISITTRRGDFDILPNNETFNLLNVTVESIYNLPSFFNQYSEYKCGTVLRIDQATENSSIIFDNGRWTELCDVEQTKSWKVLSNLDSRARHSKYKISCDCDSVKSSFKRQFDLKTAVHRNGKRIEWNSMHRVLLDDDCVNNIVDRLKKHKCWPFEVMVSPENSKSIPYEDDSSQPIVYQCFVDVGQLMFPGTTKTRVLTQLYTRSLSKMKEKTGLSTYIFDDCDNNSRGSQRSYDLERLESEIRYDVESFPVYTETGEPVLILIEFELYRPLIAARVLEDYNEALDALKNQPKPKLPLYVYTPYLAHDQYVDCIDELIDFLGESYRDFIEKSESQKLEENNISSKCRDTKDSRKSDDDEAKDPHCYIQDEMHRFKQYLHESGKYATMHSKLKNKIINLLDQKFALKSSDWQSIENQHFVSACYTYLVEEMHVTLNTKLDGRLSTGSCNNDDKSPDQVWLRAEEAYEFQNYEKAEELITQFATDDSKNPDALMIFAAHFARKSDVGMAIECCKTAIELNARHKIALLFYGVLLALKEEYDDAEKFLKSVVHLYPRFVEGWVVLHLFYIKIQYHPGIELTLSTAEKCTRDRTRDTENMIFLTQEPIAWSTRLCAKNRVFHLTAVLLLKLNLHEFASLAMTQELCHADKTVEFLYFTGVCRYVRGDYEGAIDCLSEAETIIGPDYSVATLLGHSRYKLNDLDKAIAHYESVDMMFDRPENIHLVHLRLGFHYIDVDDYERARSVFLRASKHTCTSKLWLGIGIASYHLKTYDECEIALMEANRIDDEDPEIWAYLCLLNIAMDRRDEFSQCYRQMVKNNLRNDKLSQLVQRSMDATGYSSPIVVLDECQCSV